MDRAIKRTENESPMTIIFRIRSTFSHKIKQKVICIYVIIFKLTIDLNVTWNELTILWNGLTVTWNDLTWNKMTMQRTDRKATVISTNPTSVQLHRMPWKLKEIQASS